MDNPSLQIENVFHIGSSVALEIKLIGRFGCSALKSLLLILSFLYWFGKSIIINCGEIMGMIDLCPFDSLD